MRLVIAGSRTVTNEAEIHKTLDELFPSIAGIDTVISGTARGPDLIGAAWARKHGIKVEDFPAAWDQYGKRAGMMRNHDMAVSGTHVVVFYDGTSRGSRNMIEEAIKEGCWIKVVWMRNV